MTVEYAAEKTADNPQTLSLGKVLLWACLFQIALQSGRLKSVLTSLNLPDADDFLRLHQIRTWMNGQDWYDLVVHRMAPPQGASLHWSRIVDVPVASLISFFDLFVDTQTAEKIAVVVWPLMLMCATICTIVVICDKLIPDINRVITLLLAATCANALFEFAPGRIDHHGIQILLMSLAWLGLAYSETRWGHFLVGITIAFSVAIGFDLLLIIVLLLAWLGLEWASGIDKGGRGLKSTALGLVLTSLLLYPLFVPPSDWFSGQCDANSLFYLTAQLGVAAGFVVLASLSNLLVAKSTAKTFLMRLLAGAVFGGVLLVILAVLFPGCRAGPMSGISMELRTEWLSRVLEAKGLVASAISTQEGWLSNIGYLLLVAFFGGLTVYRKGRQHPHLVAIYAAFVVAAIASFIQMRALRVGVLASVPVCAAIVHYAWVWIDQNLHLSNLMRGISKAMVIIVFSSVTWLALDFGFSSVLKASEQNSAMQASEEIAPPRTDTIDEKHQGFCTKQSYFAFLGTLPKGLVFSELNTGPAILVFTDHFVVGGNYHRNESEILDGTRFFKSNAAKALEILVRRKPDYLTYCTRPKGTGRAIADMQAMDNLLLDGRIPPWLELVSPPADRLKVYAVKLP